MHASPLKKKLYKVSCLGYSKGWLLTMKSIVAQETAAKIKREGQALRKLMQAQRDTSDTDDKNEDNAPGTDDQMEDDNGQEEITTVCLLFLTFLID